MNLRLILSFLLLFSSSVAANEHRESLIEIASHKLDVWIEDPSLISAVLAQNEAHRALSAAEILALDKQWKSEIGKTDAPLITRVLTNEASNILRSRKDAEAGIVTEVFVMDNRGLNVGQSDVTSDFWQGDEDKWQESMTAGNGAIHISDIELDPSTQQYQSQISLAIADPETGASIGVITFGIDLEMLE